MAASAGGLELENVGLDPLRIQAEFGCSQD
jgi:hypothetical protein